MGSVEHLKVARPYLPEAMSDRQQDISEPLAAIADLAGGEWPSRMRDALLELFGASSADGSIGVQLLRDIRSVFEEKGVERIASADLAAALCEIEGQPWAEWQPWPVCMGLPR
jgi:putative DNA primase/helicase